ncbi:MAG: hypothetical protein AB7I79_14625 [Rhizobiaceae bacterium]
MSQLSLFDSPKPTSERRPPDLAYVRKHLNRLLRLARDAGMLPWSEAETRKWESFFPELTALLPPEEGEPLAKAFAAELERLKAA